MKPTRSMWISAGVVGVILAGGASVAAVASAGRIDQARMERTSEARQDGLPFANPSGTSAAPSDTSAGGPSSGEPERNDPTQRPDDFVVSHELDSNSPADVLDYWTRERMEEAEPLPMPVVTVNPKDRSKD